MKTNVSLNLNVIALQKGFVVPTDFGMNNYQHVATVQTHLMKYGYMLDEESFKSLTKDNIPNIVRFNDEVIEYLRTMTGEKLKGNPFYKNFPEEVMSLSDMEIFFNAFVHYLSGGQWEPNNHRYEKPIKFEKIKYKIITKGDFEKFDNIFNSLLSINTSLTPNDLEVIKWFVSSGRPLSFPKTIPFKENLCTLAGMGIEGLPIKSTTDVLRIAVHMSGGDISLPKVPSTYISSRYGRKSYNDKRKEFLFKKFNRKERRFLLGLLENTNLDASEMVLKRERWVRLGEILHPGEYKNKYPKTYKTFQLIRNEKVESFYGKLNKAMEKGLEYTLPMLKDRPGEFARRMDFLCRTYPKKLDLIFQFFGESVGKVSNKVLFEMFEHFEDRGDGDKKRQITIKGARRATVLKTLPALDKKIVESIHQNIFKTLKDKFTQLEPLGKCYVDERLKLIPLPSNMRSLNLSLKPTIRGQKTPINNPDAKVIRFYCHWDGRNKPTDLDLSCSFINDKSTVTLSYSTVGLCVGKSCHSGDIRHVRRLCAEYIDVDIENAKEMGFKHVVFDVRNFDGKPMHVVDAAFGYMEREFPSSNQTWLPETIVDAQMLTSDANGIVIGIFDLEEKAYIHLDVDTSSITARGDKNYINSLIDTYIKPPKFSVYDLVMMHVETRGELVTLDTDVDTYFRYEDFTNSYEKTGLLMGV